MTNPILALILGGQTSAWNVPAPPGYPRRTLEWYLDRARGVQDERRQHAIELREPDWRVVREAQRIIEEALRND